MKSLACVCLAAAWLLAAIPVSAEESEDRTPPTMGEVLEASQPADWMPLDQANTLYMELAGGQVIIRLAPEFAPQHVANIKTLVREGFFEVELTALQDWGQKTIDVGELGFNKQILLKLNTDYLAGQYDLNQLGLLWEVDGTRDGRLESVPGVSINANWLRADLSHFSKYVMASN